MSSVTVPNVARYQLRYTPIVIKLWSCRWSNLWSNTFLTAFFHFPNRPKYARLKGFRRFSLSCGANTVYAPKASALPTALHPVMSMMFLNRNKQPNKISTLNYTITSKKCQPKQHRKLDLLCIICKHLIPRAKFIILKLCRKYWEDCRQVRRTVSLYQVQEFCRKCEYTL